MDKHRQTDDLATSGTSTVSYVVLALFGLLMGVSIDQSLWGALTGISLGVLLAAWQGAHTTARRTRLRLHGLEIRLRALEGERGAPAAEATSPVRRAPMPASESTPMPTQTIPAQRPPSPPVPRPAPPPPPAPRPHVPGFFEKAESALREFFLGGNTVVRVGVLVLLVGVSLLAKWAVDRDLFSIEARLTCASLIGVALTGLGYRTRLSRPGFGTTLQGGGLAALYLVVFSAFRLYGLIPAELAFGLFTAIAGAGVLLAVNQKSQALVFISSLGGFLAPLLTPAAYDNHLVLFSYYLLLNITVACVAWFHTWRPLNLLAFISTYGVATIWGSLRYNPADLATTLPFLLAFMVLFTAEAVLFALRSPPRLRGLVDGTLVFGTALITLLLQSFLVSNMEFGMAYSAAGFGLFYATLGTVLWRRFPETLRPLCEAFLALGVGFATMAIPFAFTDAYTTAIAWSLEGAGLYWVGLRQQRRFTLYSGVVLQGLAGISLLGSSLFAAGNEFLPLANGRFLTCTALAFAGFFMAWQTDARGAHLLDWERKIGRALVAWGLLGWSLAVVGEIDEFVATAFRVSALLVAIGVSGIALERVAHRLAWPRGRHLSLVAIPATLLAFLLGLESQPHLFANAGSVAWPLCLAALYGVLHRLEEDRPPWLAFAYAPALWLVTAVVAVGLMGFAETGLGLKGDWPLAALGFGIGAVLTTALWAVDSGLGPFGRYASAQLREGMTPLAALAFLWSLAAQFSARGDGIHPYLPFLNPIDVALMLASVAVLGWWIRGQKKLGTLIPGFEPVHAYAILAGSAFLWINGLLVRSVHQWTNVAFQFDALWDSVPLQVLFSIVWTLVALTGMLVSTKRSWRTSWMTCAALLAVVVVKLFTVDLSQLSAGAKILTFLVVGGLLLVVGYLSPVPPSDESQTPSPGNDGPGAPPILSVLLALGLFASGHAANAADAALEPDDFARGRQLALGSSGALQHVALDAAVYRGCVESGLADLRVFNALGEEVPHAIGPGERHKPSPREFPLPFFPLRPTARPPGETFAQGAPTGPYRLDAELSARGAILKIRPEPGFENKAEHTPPPSGYLIDATKARDPIDRLTLTFAPSETDFVIPIQVEGSNDLTHFDVLIQRSAVARLDRAGYRIERNQIELPATKKRYLRLTWPGTDLPAELTSVEARVAGSALPTPRKQGRIVGHALREEPGVVLFDLGGAIPIDRLQLDLGSANRLVEAELYSSVSRKGPWHHRFSGLLYQIEHSGSLQNQPIPIPVSRHRYFRLVVSEKGGGVGDETPQLIFSWQPEQLLFVARGGAPFTLAYGRAGIANTRFAAHDLRRIANSHTVDRTGPPAKLGHERILAGESALAIPEAPIPRRTYALWGVLILSVGLVFGLGLRLMRELA